jgi:glycerol-3-phosphate dehydrogenase (NAD(P)+)
MKIAVLGAGAWGTALAVAAAARHDVLLWARSAEQAAAMVRERLNRRYLPEVELPRRPGREQRPAGCDAPRCGRAAGHRHSDVGSARHAAGAARGQPAVWLCKGFEAGTGLLGHEVARTLRPGVPCAVLSGPSFALEVARGQPTALVVASESTDLAEATSAALHGDALRIYTATDIVGVEVGGALKNVLAIATGMLDGMAASGEAGAPGLNARAALITRGLAEMTRLGVALGARPRPSWACRAWATWCSPPPATCRATARSACCWRRAGAGRGAGTLGHVAEGVYTARTAADRARQLGVDMPITQAVVDVLEGRLQPRRGDGAADGAPGARAPRPDQPAPPKPFWRQASNTATATALLRFRLRWPARIGRRTLLLRREARAPGGRPRSRCRTPASRPAASHAWWCWSGPGW